MEANELRLGNWVQLENYTPYQISNHHFELNENGYNECLDISIPIPLTEEWLLKFGFEDGLPLAQYVLKFKIIHPTHLHIDIEEDGVTCRVYCPLDESIYLNIKHVHQLQNLYFALTGEELTIKE